MIPGLFSRQPTVIWLWQRRDTSLVHSINFRACDGPTSGRGFIEMWRKNISPNSTENGQRTITREVLSRCGFQKRKPWRAIQSFGIWNGEPTAYFGMIL